MVWAVVAPCFLFPLLLQRVCAWLATDTADKSPCCGSSQTPPVHPVIVWLSSFCTAFTINVLFLVAKFAVTVSAAVAALLVLAAVQDAA